VIALSRKVALILTIILATISFASLKALIVYVSEYKNPGIIPLPFARKDAMNMRTAIQSIPGAMVKILENPGYDDFVREFKKWAKSAEEGETLIFYYAGHGISHEGQFYFIPSGADPEDEFTWIPFSRLKKYISSKTRMVWLIDACYSGSIVKGRPLKALSAGEGQVIITSSTGNEISREMPDGSGGMFTVTLVEELKGAADEDGMDR